MGEVARNSVAYETDCRIQFAVTAEVLTQLPCNRHPTHIFMYESSLVSTLNNSISSEIMRRNCQVVN